MRHDQIWDEVATCGQNSEFEDGLQLEGARGVDPPFQFTSLQRPLGLSTHFPGSTWQLDIINLKKYLCLQAFSDATGSHPVTAKFKTLGHSRKKYLLRGMNIK